MRRFEDAPDLFGSGVGVATYGNFECNFCGTKWDDREGKNGEVYGDNESIGHTTFAGLACCRGCFYKIENEILARIDDLLPWLARIVKSQSAVSERRIALLKKVTETLSRPA